MARWYDDSYTKVYLAVVSATYYDPETGENQGTHIRKFGVYNTRGVATAMARRKARDYEHRDSVVAKWVEESEVNWKESV